MPDRDPHPSSAVADQALQLIDDLAPPAEGWRAGELVRRAIEEEQRAAAKKIGVTLEEFRSSAFYSATSSSSVLDEIIG